MREEAVFSDGTQEYRVPWEPKENSRVKIRIRLAHGEEAAVYLIHEEEEIRMRLGFSRKGFDYYETEVQLGDQWYSYYFQLEQEGRLYYYDRVGMSSTVRPEYAFAIVPGFSTPDWAKGAVMYQILVDRFFNGDPSNDVEDREYFYIQTMTSQVRDWYKYPSDFGVAEFYGGDLEGVRQKLEYLKSLGVEVIYFNPLFVSPSNHKYDISDYDAIDPHYGKIVADGGEVLSEWDQDNRHATKYRQRVTDQRNLEASNQLFIQLVEEAHAKGIRVILDGVFNHCGSFNKWMDREKIYENQEGYALGAYLSKESPYVPYFSFADENAWPDNDSYEGWWGHNTLPKLNYEQSQELYDYILEIGRKWVSPPYNADGWRLDVAADLGHSPEMNHKFWRDFRKAVKEANPNAIILAEHYGDASSWLGGDQWDTVMNYDAFMEPVSFFLTGMEKHSDSYDAGALGDGACFESVMKHFMSSMMTPSLYCSMNQLSNHDHSRFLTRTNRKVGRAAVLGKEAAEQDVSVPLMKEAIMIQMTWPGAPTLYYGDEAGLCGFTDPDNRRTYPWEKVNLPLLDFHRDMIMVHKNSTALRTGAFCFLTCGAYLVSYGRFDGNEQMAVVINSGAQEMEVEIPVWKIEVPMDAVMQQVMVTNEIGYSILPVERKVENGMLRLSLKPYTGVVLRHQEKESLVRRDRRNRLERKLKRYLHNKN